MEILKAVEDVYNKKQEAEERNRKKMELPQSEHSKLYDQMRAALYDTQKCVEVCIIYIYRLNGNLGV